MDASLIFMREVYINSLKGTISIIFSLKTLFKAYILYLIHFFCLLSSADTLTPASSPLPGECGASLCPDVGSGPLNLECRVCTDKASGFHYGVHACEGCKVRRTGTLQPHSATSFSELHWVGRGKRANKTGRLHASSKRMPVPSCRGV